MKYHSDKIYFKIYVQYTRHKEKSKQIFNDRCEKNIFEREILLCTFVHDKLDFTLHLLIIRTCVHIFFFYKRKHNDFCEKTARKIIIVDFVYVNKCNK